MDSSFRLWLRCVLSKLDLAKYVCNGYNALLISRGGAVVACRAHNPKVAGSSPAPATKKICLALSDF